MLKIMPEIKKRVKSLKSGEKMKKIIAAFLIFCFFMSSSSAFAYDGIKVRKYIEFTSGSSSHELYVIVENYYKKQAEKIEKLSKKYEPYMYYSPKLVYEKSGIYTHITLENLTLDKNGIVIKPVKYSCERSIGEDTVNCKEEQIIKKMITDISSIKFDSFGEQMLQLTDNITFSGEIDIEQREKIPDFETNTFVSDNEVTTNITAKIKVKEKIYPTKVAIKYIAVAAFYVYILWGLFVACIYSVFTRPDAVKNRVKQSFKMQEIVYDDNKCIDFDKVIKYTERMQDAQQNSKNIPNVNDDYTKVVKPACKPYVRYIKKFDTIATEYYTNILKQKDMPLSANALITLNKDGTIKSIERLSCRGGKELNYHIVNADDERCKEVINILYNLNIPKFSNDMTSEYLTFSTDIVKFENNKPYPSGVRSSLPMKFSIMQKQFTP